MRIYVGQTRSRKLIARLGVLGWGELVNRGEFPPRRLPWCLDNGAYSDWKAGRTFDPDAFMRDVRLAAKYQHPPDFIVVPDLVGGGRDSLALSLTWRRRLDGEINVPFYLAIQDGMDLSEIPDMLADGMFDGIFLGGTLGWKLKNGGTARKLAGRRLLHIGRVGTYRRVRWAFACGADSIDSSLPLWSENNLQRFMRACTFCVQQTTLFDERTCLP